jgi:hypothetical protein
MTGQTITMPTICALAGSLPERYRSFLNPDGDLQCGDAFGLEAQWCISMLDDGTPDYPEQEWSLSQIEEDERGVGCFDCGDENADTVRGLCFVCR